MWQINTYLLIYFLGSHSGSSLNKVKDQDRAKARDTATSMNMTVETWIQIPRTRRQQRKLFHNLISDQMERQKLLRPAKKVYT